MQLLKPLQNFSRVEVKRRNVPHKILYHFVLRSKSKFQIEFELQIKTSVMFLNKSILGKFVKKIYFSNPRAPKMSQNYS